jgi:uncharacterized protein (AIM24 family)
MDGQLLQYLENTSEEGKIFAVQNPYTLLVNVSTPVYASQGTMIAYKGAVDFEYKGAGISRFFKSFATGESLPLMKITGQGDVYLARDAQQVHIVELTNDQLTITGRNVLAFTEGIDWDIQILRAGVMGFAAGGLFNATLKGTGSIALTSYGTPVVIPVNGNEVFSDVNSIIAWSSGLEVSVKSSFKAQQLIGRGSGESFQMKFTGNGYIVVQPSEGLRIR